MDGAGIRPSIIAGRILVDGGVLNLVPYVPLQELTDMTIAVNVSSVRRSGDPEVPNALESVLGTFDIMQTATLAEKMKNNPADIYVRPEIHGVFPRPY